MTCDSYDDNDDATATDSRSMSNCFCSYNDMQNDLEVILPLRLSTSPRPTP